MKVGTPGLSKAVGKRDYPVLKAGEYRVQCTDASYGEASTGRPQLKLTLNVLQNVTEENDESCVGRRIWANINLAMDGDEKPEMALYREKNACDCFNVAVSKTDKYETDDFIDNEAIAVVKVTVNKQDGKERNEVDHFKPVEE